MVKVTLNGKVLAEAPKDKLEVVENNFYFPPSALNKEYFKDTTTSTVCGWKGTASYYDLEDGATKVKDVAWYYPEPKDAAKQIKNYVAFYKNKVQIEE